ncbi:MAG TPA: hypothetical protein VLZ83_16475 [Edaphocola sp.]|nr:hypothetical protein [Edaphocola sp.]
MLRVLDWFAENWKIVTLILGFLFIFGFVKPITDMLRGVKDGMKEIFTPLGFFVFITLIGFVIFLFFVYKGRI